MSDIDALETMTSRMSVGGRRRRGACSAEELESALGGLRIAGRTCKRAPPPFLQKALTMNRYAPYLAPKTDGRVIHIEDSESQDKIQPYLLRPVELKSQTGTITRGVLAAVTRVSRRSSRGHGLDMKMRQLSITDGSCRGELSFPQKALRLTHCENFINGEPIPSCSSRIFYIEDINTLHLIDESENFIPPTPLTTFTFPPTVASTSSIEILDDEVAALPAQVPKQSVDILSLILEKTHV